MPTVLHVAFHGDPNKGKQPNGKSTDDDDDHHCSIHLSVVLMLWLIGVGVETIFSAYAGKVEECLHSE